MKNLFYYGNIMKCTFIDSTNYDSSLVKSDIHQKEALLIKVDDYHFIDVKSSIKKTKVLKSYPQRIGSLFVDIYSLTRLNDINKKTSRQKTK